MNVITVRRTIRTNAAKRGNRFRQLAEPYFTREVNWQFGIELVLFAIISAVSAWPIFVTAGTLSTFLQSTHG